MHARISPVDGSIATTAPTLFCINNSPYFWSLASSESINISPATEAVS